MQVTETQASKRRKVFLYGCGLVAPGAANLAEFIDGIWTQKSHLESDPELNDAFLVGKPKFDFNNYRDWILERHAPTRFNQIVEKGGENVRLALGGVIDALRQNPKLEPALKTLDPRVMVCLGSGLGDFPVVFQAARDRDRATQTWNHFWADSVRNSACAAYCAGKEGVEGVPPNPRGMEGDPFAVAQAWETWDAFWAPQSEALQEYLQEFMKIESQSVGADVATDKLNVIRAKAKAKKALQEKFKHPAPPWECVSPNLLWNLPNGAAAQVSMTLGIHGPSYNTNGACATFGLLIRQALDGIRSGQYDVAIIGTVDNTPPAEVVSAFSAGRLLATGKSVGTPLCEMRGTHVSGGCCVWIVGAEDALEKLGVPHQGIEIMGAGISSDAEHIITPSQDGPKLAIRASFADAGISPQQINTWDLHATGTPGDYNEMKLIEDFVPQNAVITARKGLFGHGMATNGGWEISAQVFGAKKQGRTFVIPPSGIPSQGVHPSISALGRNIATDAPVSVDSQDGALICGKLSMGVGGISACVITRVQ